MGRAAGGRPRRRSGDCCGAASKRIRSSRLSAIGDARLELDDADSGVDEAAAASVPAPLKPAAWRRAMPAVIAALVVGSAGAFAWWLKPVHQAQPRHSRDRHPADRPVADRKKWSLAGHVSPTGSTLVYGANRPLCIRHHQCARGDGTGGDRGRHGTVLLVRRTVDRVLAAGGASLKYAVRGGSITTICEAHLHRAHPGGNRQPDPPSRRVRPRRLPGAGQRGQTGSPDPSES